jgi:hypothetical protein
MAASREGEDGIDWRSIEESLREYVPTLATYTKLAEEVEIEHMKRLVMGPDGLERLNDYLFRDTPGLAAEVKEANAHIFAEAKENEKWRAVERAQRGCMVSTPTAAQLSPTAVLLVQTLDGHERRAWHEWAEANGYKRHFPVNTSHFDTQDVWYCRDCKTAQYLSTQTDYDTEGHPCGGYVQCRISYIDSDGEEERCGAFVMFDNDDPEDRDLVLRRSFNAMCLTNNETIGCARGVRRKRKKRHHSEPKSPKGEVSVTTLPYRETLVLDGIARIE